MTLANKITIARILLIPFFIGSLVYYRAEVDSIRFLALAIFCVAILTDAVDGFLARFFNQRTTLGIVLDPIADKLLLSSAILTMTFARNLPLTMQMPAWIAIVIISRDVIIVLGSIVVFLIKQNIRITPSILGKLTTAAQMSAVVLTLLQFKYATGLWVVVAIATVCSGVEYLYKGSVFLGEAEGRHRHDAPGTGVRAQGDLTAHVK